MPDPVRPDARRITDVPVLLQFGMHLLVAALLILAVVHALTAPTGPDLLVVLVAAVLGAVYGAGPAIGRVRGTFAGSAIWLAVVLAVWLALLALSPDAIWLAFPWFFLLLHLLPWHIGVPAVALTTAAAIGGFAWHQGSLTPGTAIGPVLGALVAIATVWGYTSVAAESDRRRELIGELQRTRADLALAERSAGAMAERERLAREIHDTLAQGLSSIQLLLRAAARTLPEDGGAEPATVAAARLRIEQAREAAQDNLAEARRFVAELAPAGLAGRSLQAALDRLCRTTSERTGLPVTFAVQDDAGDGSVGDDEGVRDDRGSGDGRGVGGDGGSGRGAAADGDRAYGLRANGHRAGARVSGGDDRRVVVPTPVEVALLRIAQSAVANVSAHANASRAAVTLTLMDSTISLDIVDDGQGFDPDSPPPRTTSSGGFGIPAMRSRANELGGTLTVESAPGHGTAVAATFPLPRDSS